MNPPKSLHSNARLLRCLGILGIALYAIYAGLEVVNGHPGNLLWACHLGTLAVGLGLLFRSPTCNAIGFLWLTAGAPLWVMDLLMGRRLLPTSLFDHVAGLVLGVVGVRKLGLPKHASWKAVVALALLHLLCRWVTPEEENVNLAFAISPGWEPYFPSHLMHALTAFALCSALLVGVEFGLRKTGFAAPPKRA